MLTSNGIRLPHLHSCQQNLISSDSDLFLSSAAAPISDRRKYTIKIHMFQMSSCLCSQTTTNASQLFPIDYAFQYSSSSSRLARF